MSRLSLIIGGIVLLVACGLGGGFVKLGMESVPPAQTPVHKVLAASAFASSTAAAPVLPAMPPVPLPTMPAPRPAPGLMPAPAH